MDPQFFSSSNDHINYYFTTLVKGSCTDFYLLLDLLLFRQRHENHCVCLCSQNKAGILIQLHMELFLSAYYFATQSEFLESYFWCLSFQKNEVFEALRRYTKPANLWDLYAFSCDPSTIKIDSEPKWRLLREYFRLFRKSLPQLRGVEEVSLCNDWWRLTRVNSSYSLCSTYPSELIVPRGIRYLHALDNIIW